MPHLRLHDALFLTCVVIFWQKNRIASSLHSASTGRSMLRSMTSLPPLTRRSRMTYQSRWRKLRTRICRHRCVQFCSTSNLRENRSTLENRLWHCSFFNVKSRVNSAGSVIGRTTIGYDDPTVTAEAIVTDVTDSITSQFTDYVDGSLTVEPAVGESLVLRELLVSIINYIPCWNICAFRRWFYNWNNRITNYCHRSSNAS